LHLPSRCLPLRTLDFFGFGRFVQFSERAALDLSGQAHGRYIERELREHGIVARARSWKGLAEEQPGTYKDVDLVVEVVHRAGLAKKVARMRPIGVIKG
jgi:RNA-splicing ligase RtcB